MFNSKKKSKGSAIPVLIFLTVFFGVVFWASAGMLIDTNKNADLNPITNPNFNTSASIFADNTTVINTDCGGDVICNMGNIYNLMSVSSNYILLTILVITPAIVVLGYIVIAWIRGV